MSRKREPVLSRFAHPPSLRRDKIAQVQALLRSRRWRRVGQVCIAVRDTHGIDASNPLPFFAVKQRIEAAMSAYAGRFVVVALPNITNVFYGRDVGYSVERIVLDETTEDISATKIRRLAAHPGDPKR